MAQKENMQIRINSENGGIEYIGHRADQTKENYIAGPSELPLIGVQQENKVEGYSAVLLGYRVGGNGTYHRKWLTFKQTSNNNHEFVFANDDVEIMKRFVYDNDVLVVEFTVTGKAEWIEIAELAVSVPVNNYYCPWRYDQRFLYDHKVYEHIHPGGEHGYQLIERLNGTQPILYCIPLNGTRFEHTAHFSGTIGIERPSIMNHSWPGSSLLFLHAKGYLDEHKFEPLIDQSLISSATLSSDQTREYRMELGFAADRASFNHIQVNRGKVHITAAPGMTGPSDGVFQVIAYGQGELTISKSDSFEIVSERERVDGRSWQLRFLQTGKQIVSIANSTSEPALLIFWVTERLRDLLERRADFILDRQVFHKEGDVLNGAILAYTIDGFDDFIGEGLYAKEASLWGNGSYEAGITEAMFAAEKNVALPNPRQVAELEKYVETYVRRYLQNPDNDEVIWWCGEFSTTRSYNYMHVANFYYSMYRIAKLHRLTEKYNAREYLTFTYRTLMKMYEVSRPMDLIAGMMGGQRIFTILEGLQAEDMVEFYYTLLLKVRHQGSLLFQGDVPYGSECAYDNTGYECVAFYAQYFHETNCLEEIKNVMLTVRGEQPAWWWHGSDIRWWDAGTDYAETCHHYTSPINSSALLMFVRRGVLKPNPAILSLIYGGFLGSVAKIHGNGRLSMSYCWEQESSNYGHHVFSGDGGLSLFGTLLGLRSFAYFSLEHGPVGYLCDLNVNDDESELVIIPLDVAGRKLSWHLEHDAGNLQSGDVECSIGWIKQCSINKESGEMQLTTWGHPEGADRAEMLFHLKDRPIFVSVNGEKSMVTPVANCEYCLSYPVSSGREEEVVMLLRYD